MSYKKKLIEVALPLAEINDASAYDKMPGIGPHPKGIHQWWARLPLPAARAVLFASVVDDPSAHPEKFPTIEAQNAERERLFGILRQLMQKRLHEHPEVYALAREEMLKHCAGKLPPVLDPFAGGGSIPLEAARLGFEAHAGDLNPVAVLLNKCNLELVPRWLDQPPVNPEARKDVLRSGEWRGARGLAEDVRYYGRIVLERARKKIGHLYPKVQIVQEKDGSWRHATPEEVRSGKRTVREANVIAWLWARTVASPNPAAQGAHVPLISTFWLSSKKGTLAWLNPVVNRKNNTWRFEIRTGQATDIRAVKSGTKTGRAAFRCLLTGAPILDDYIKQAGKAGLMQARLLAIVADLGRGRVYLPAVEEHASTASQATPSWRPEGQIPTKLTGGTCAPYGLNSLGDLFTPRQLTALVTFSDLVREVRQDVLKDARDAGLSTKDAEEYANAVATFLALTFDRLADNCNTLCRWRAPNPALINLFARHAIPMIWDFCEGNPVGASIGSWHACLEREAECLETVGATAVRTGMARQVAAANTWEDLNGVLVSTDPPYYANIGYAALSDFFYVWLRRTIGDLHPELFKTMLVPKEPELVAAPERFDGDKERAKEHFETGFRKAFTALREKMDPRFPLTVYYAYKQKDEEAGADEDEGAEQRPSNGVDLTTGWETLLEALLGSGFQITATWPVRASQKWRMVAMGTNALASYIILACRARPADAPQCSRSEFIAALKKELPSALRHLQQGNVAPVDLAQASIGPGMAVFSRYSRVLESSGKPMTVRTALALINQTLDEVLAEQEAEFDADTRWALAWFEQHGMEEGSFGDAETLSKAKNTAVNGLVEAGIITARAGKVRLVARDELPEAWDPAEDRRLTVWEATQHLIRALEQGGESAAAELLRKLGGGMGETARELSYRLHKVCERKDWSKEALSYNGLVVAWPGIVTLARAPKPSVEQRELFGRE